MDSLSNRVIIHTLARSWVLSFLDHPRISEPLKVQKKKKVIQMSTYGVQTDYNYSACSALNIIFPF